MRKFNFRLQKVLEYRQMEEGWAKNAYLTKHQERLEAEDDLDVILNHRTTLLADTSDTLPDRLALEAALIKTDDDERAQKAAIEVLVDEEAKALGEWTAKRRELKALQILYDQRFQEWLQESNREEQNELDDWTNMRRSA